MGNRSSNPEKYETEESHVVIVGGGYGGCQCAMALKRAGVNFTLIDPKEFFYHNVGSLRAAVDPDFVNKIIIDYKKSFGDSFVRGKATTIGLESREVKVECGDVAEVVVGPYTDLVIATGSSGPFPGRSTALSFAQIEKELTESAEQIEKAESIVIVGGGAVGIELAGEIRDKYKFKRITLVHSRGSLLEDSKLGTKIQDNVKAILESIDVDLRFEEKVSFDNLVLNRYVPGQYVQTNKGNSYEADLVFQCTGLKADISVTELAFGKDKFNELGQLKVTPELLVEGYSNVYAVGDCTNWPQEKMGAHAGDHGELVAENVILSSQKKQRKEYKPKFTGMVVTIGKGAGVGVYNGWNLPSFVTSFIKGKDLFSGKFWKMMEQPYPS